VAAEADLPTPTHRKPRSDPIRQSPVHENAYWEGVRETLTSSTDEDEVVVYTRESVLWEGKEGGIEGINDWRDTRDPRDTTRRLQRAW
jgi:hypothetical protein